MSVSRDFIDYYSPEAKTGKPMTGKPWCRANPFARHPRSPDCGPITLAFGFRDRHNIGQTAISFRQAGCFFLTLGEKTLRRLGQADGLVDLGAAPGAVGPLAGSAPPYLHRPS